MEKSFINYYSPTRLAYKGFLLYSKAMGGLLWGEFDPGSLGDAAMSYEPITNRLINEFFNYIL